MQKQWRLVALLIIAGLVIPACSPFAAPAAPAATPAPPKGRIPISMPDETATPDPLPSVRQASFPYQPVAVSARPSLAPYGFDPSRAANQNLLRELTDAQRALLAQNGFVVSAKGAPQVYDIYKQGKERNAPLFITSDAVLHAYHVLYDYVLRSVEIDHLVGDLRGLNKALLATAQEQDRTAQGSVKEAARLNLAYLAVAARLLDNGTTVPAAVNDLVQKELALIESHQGYAESPIFGYKEDYSQYAPRGHYTRNDQLKAYFTCMMWYGRMGFRLRPGDQPALIDKGRAETRQALLLVAALSNAAVGSEPALAVWQRIYDPTVFFVGQSDDLTVHDYRSVAQRVYGALPPMQTLADDARLDAFIATATALPAPRIVASYVLDLDNEDPAAVTRGFRLLGQRFIPDSYMFQQLVYNKVGSQGRPRLFPKGLDVLAVLGSQRAYEILDTVYKETAYDNYKQQMARLQKEYAALPQSDWVQNLYWGWLYALRPLAEPKGQGYPSFMQTKAWVDKDLHTALGSWAELRHDTVLYAKQSTTIRLTALPPELDQPRGYVEPNALVYARLAALATQTRLGLQNRGLLGGEYQAKLESFEALLLRLKAMSEKELAGQALSDEEYTVIRDIGSFLQNLTTFSEQQAGKITSLADNRMAVVADVHTDTNSGRALEEGVGDAFPIYVLVPVDGTLTLTMGAVFSYYEFTLPLADRLTDEAWQKMSPRPDRPVWTESFIR